MVLLGLGILLLQAGIVTAILKSAINGEWVYTFVFVFIFSFLRMLSNPRRDIKEIKNILNNNDKKG